MDLRKVSPAGRKLLQEHPDKTPLELAALGLSEKDFEYLSKEIPTTPNPPIPPPPVEEPTPLPQPIRKINPVSVQPTQTVKRPVHQEPIHPGAVRLFNKKTGRTRAFDGKMAKMLATKYPNEFEIRQ